MVLPAVTMAHADEAYTAAGQEVTIENETIVDKTSVLINGATGTTLSGTNILNSGEVIIGQASVDAPGSGATTLQNSSIDTNGNVTVGGSDITVADGSDVESDGGNITMQAERLTVGTAGEIVPEDSLVANNITLNVSGESKIQGAAMVMAKNGQLSILGGTTATNTITGEHTLVGASGALSVNGGMNNITAKASLEGGTGVEVIAGVINTVDAAQVKSLSGAVHLQAQSNLIHAGSLLQAATGVSIYAINLTGANGNLIEGTTIKTESGGIKVGGLINWVEDGSQLMANSGNIEITGLLANLVTGVTEEGNLTIYLTANNGNVKISGGQSAENLVEAVEITAKGTDGFIQIEGKASGVFSGSLLTADTGITLVAHGSDADDGNFIANSVLQSGAGQVNITAANINKVDYASFSARTGISIVSNGEEINDGNSVYYSTLKTTTGDIALTAQSINYVQDTDMTAEAGRVLISGDSNLLWGGSEITAQTGILLDSNGVDDSHGNAVDGSKLTTATGDISLQASLSNVVSGGAQLLAQSGNVILVTDSDVGYANIVTGPGTAITAQNGYLLLDGGQMETADNFIESATLKATGTDESILTGNTDFVTGSITIRGKANSIGEETQLLAEQGVLISSGGTAADDGNVVYTSLVEASKGGDVQIVATGLNYLMDADIKAAAGKVNVTGALNMLINGSALEGATGVSVVSDGLVIGNGNLVDASRLLATSGDVLIGARLSNQVSNGAEIKAQTGSVTISGSIANIVSGATTTITAGNGALNFQGASTAENHVEDATLQAFGSNGSINMEGVGNGIYNSALLQADAGVSLIAHGQADDDGNLIDTSAVHALAGDVTIEAYGVNMVRVGQVTAEAGKLVMSGESNIIREGSTVEVAEGVFLTATGTAAQDSNTISGSTVTTSANDIILLSDIYNVVGNAALQSEAGSIKLQAVDADTAVTNNIVMAQKELTTTLTANQNILIEGTNYINGADFGSVRLETLQGNIDIKGSNTITNASLLSSGAEGDVTIMTGEGNKTTVIEDSVIAGETVTIMGDTTARGDEDLALVTGNNLSITSRGEDAGAGLILNNVLIKDTQKEASNIIAKGDGDIVVLNRVDVQNGALTIEHAAASDGRIVVDAGNVLNLRSEAVLNGRLSGTGDINKSCGDALLLDADHTEFAGSIYVNGALGGASGSGVDGNNAGSWVEISGAGVGAGASLVLKNTDLVLSATETCIGTLDTTQDDESNDMDTADTLLSTGSYTQDDNARAAFSTIGSVVEVNKGSVGDVVHATDMKLSDATLIKLDAAVNGAEVVADTIKASGTINAAAATGLNNTSTAAAPATARVYINHADTAAAANAAEGARTTIMTGSMASAINEDVLYDVAKSENGTHQRVLQERNVHLENKADGVDMVFSKNYRSVEKTTQMSIAAAALKAVADTLDHTEGALATSGNRLHQLVDAFDYTRDEGAVKRGIMSVAGTGNTLPRLMQFDTSRHHLDNLRSHLSMPECHYESKGAFIRTSHVWMAYTGAYDSLDGDSYMGDYSRTAHGALFGVDRTLNCNLRMGLSLGYESSIGRADSTRVDADTFFADVYATGVTGRYKHRASIGLATGSYDTKRGVMVEAGYHTFAGQGAGETDGLTLNMGYEICTDYQPDSRSTLSPYVAFNLSLHRLDTLTEGGLGEAGLVSAYDNEWQADAALGLNYRREFAALRNQAAAQFYANAAMRVELANDRATALNRFRGDSAAWGGAGMERSPLHFELGAGVKVPLTPSWTGSAGAAIDFGPDRSSFSINFGAIYGF